MSVPGNAKLRLDAHMPNRYQRPGHSNQIPDAREQQDMPGQGDGLPGLGPGKAPNAPATMNGRCHDAEHHGQNVLEGGQRDEPKADGTRGRKSAFAFQDWA